MARVVRGTLIAVAMFAMLSFAGCADSADANEVDPDGPDVIVTETTGGLRGVVVDDRVYAVADVIIRITGNDVDETVNTDENGEWTLSGLPFGEYFVVGTKLGYQRTQTIGVVEPNVEEPPMLKMVMKFFPDQQPWKQEYVMKGFYDCAFGTYVVTDSCDFPYRTAWDVANETGNEPPAPRSVMAFKNTQYFDIGTGATSIIQEAVWESTEVPEMKISLDETPIDAACDCSPSYMETDGASPTYNRIDGGPVPENVRVAARGFLPFSATPSTGVQFQFEIATIVFYNYEPPEDWSFVRGDEVPF